MRYDFHSKINSRSIGIHFTTKVAAEFVIHKLGEKNAFYLILSGFMAGKCTLKILSRLQNFGFFLDTFFIRYKI